MTDKASAISKDMELKRAKIKIRHLTNELDMLRGEMDASGKSYFDLFSKLEAKVKQRTEELNNALETIHKYNTQLEKMLEERTRDLVRSERQAAFSLFSQGIVHNLKNPLAVISTSAELMDVKRPSFEGLELPPEVQKYLETVERNQKKIMSGTRKMLNMVNSLMFKASQDKNETSVTSDLNEVIRQELTFLEADPIFKHQTQTTISLSEEPLSVKVVPGEIAQVFQNLVRNALDAMFEQRDKKLTIKSGRNGKYVWFSVADNGPGIPEDMRKKVFDPFFTTKPTAGTEEKGKPTGTGLGLHICTQMIRAYNGKINLKSELGKGTHFTIYLPQAANT